MKKRSICRSSIVFWPLLLHAIVGGGVCAMSEKSPGTDPGKEGRSVSQNVVLQKDDAEARVGVFIRGELFTEYHYSEKYPMPFFYPLLGPGGRHMTRRFPMEDIPEEKVRDHPHHRHLWAGWGDVNGVDFWHTPKSRQRTDSVDVESGEHSGRLQTRETWETTEGKPIIAAEREAIFYDTPEGERILDSSFTFLAAFGAVVIGDSKEASTIAFKPNPQIVVGAGGKIQDASGRVNEGEIWGKRSAWCDYSGEIDGLECGLAILDHPENICHPTYWHARNYGFLGANCFALSHFLPGQGIRGDYTLMERERLTFRYRLVIHEGPLNPDRINQIFTEYREGSRDGNNR